MNNSDAGNSLTCAHLTLRRGRVQLRLTLRFHLARGERCSSLNIFSLLTHLHRVHCIHGVSALDPGKDARLRFLRSFLRGPSVHENTVTKRLNELKIDGCSVLDVLQSRIFKQIAGRVGGRLLARVFFPVFK